MLEVQQFWLLVVFERWIGLSGPDKPYVDLVAKVDIANNWRDEHCHLTVVVLFLETGKCYLEGKV